MTSALRALTAAIVLALTVGLPGVSSAQNNDLIVKEIKFDGLFRVPIGSVRAKLRTQIGGKLDQATVSEDIKRLFAMRSFSDVRVGKKLVKGGVSIVFMVVERPTISKVLFEGHDSLDLDEIRKVVDIREFELADEQRIKSNIQKIKELYIEEGHYLAKISYKIKKLKNNLANIIFKIDEGDKVKVQSITFLNNRQIDDAELKAIMQTREGGYFSFMTSSGQFKKEFLQQDMQRVQVYYLSKGYIKIKISSPVVTLSRDKKSIDITVHVDEGNAYNVSKVNIAGNDLFTEEEILAKLSLQPGKICNYVVMRQDATKIGDKYKDLGYAFARVSITHVANEEKKTLAVTYHVQKGEKKYIGRIRIEGNKSTRDKVIRRVMRISEGDLFSATKIKKSRQLIMRQGFFESVDITDPDATKVPHLVDITVKIKERQTGTFQVGAGFSSLENFIATAQISKQNFMGHGQTLSLQATLSSIRSMYTLSFFDPYFFDSMWTFSIDLHNWTQDFDDFTRGITGGNLTFGYRFTDELHLSLGYKLDYTEISIGGLKGRSSIPIANLFRDGLTASLKSTFAYDTRNDRMFPSSGQFSTTSVEFANPNLGGDSEFTRMIARSRWYFPVLWNLVLKLNGTVGYVVSASEQGVPIFERFFVGGIFDVRGFQRNSLGPTLPVAKIREPGTSLSDFTIGGNKELIFNVELEIPIIPQARIRGVVFFDAGNAFDDGERLDVFALRTAVGFGFRWWSPVGPLRFEWGIPLDPQPGEQPIVFEFTIGNSF